MDTRRVTRNALQVLAVMVRNPEKQQYALELSRDAEVNTGTIYAVLAKLERQGLVSSQVEEIDPVTEGRPARRYYLLTPEGISYAKSAIKEAQKLIFIGGGINV